MKDVVMVMGRIRSRNVEKTDVSHGIVESSVLDYSESCTGER